MRLVNPRLMLALGVAVAAACSQETPRLHPTGPSLSTDNVNENRDNEDESESYTIAAIGDTPYGAAKLATLPDLINLINADPTVDLVAHVGDIKAGKNAACTDQYFASVKLMFDNLEDPFVYTPGDNEWADCHVAFKNNGLYTPTERLHAIRELFFPMPGQTLGETRKQVLTQASDPSNSAYVENVMWMEARVVFATFNVSGSNNDLAPWGTPLPADAGNWPSQAQESRARARANAAWVARTFAIAKRTGAAGVALFLQADMWDTLEPSLSGYDALVAQIGTLAAAFGKPVLLVNGDSHIFTIDNPFSASSPLHGVHAGTPVAENVTRVVVEGSDKGRTEYLRITVDRRKSSTSLFTLERVPLH